MKKHTKYLLFLMALGIYANAMSQEQQAGQVETRQDESRQDEQRSVRGMVAAENVASLSVEVSSRVKSIPFKVGDSFKKNATLLAFDCVVKRAEVSAAYAALQAANAEHESNLELQRHNAVGELDVDLSKARKNENEAIWVAAKGRTKHCTIKAPFDGKVAALSVHEHEMSTPDKPIMKIVGSSGLELRLVVPSTWLSWLSTGTRFTFKIDETGKEYPISIKRIGAEIDAISRTIDIFGKFVEGNDGVIPGMSGVAHFLEAESLAEVE